ncbi:ABC transporter ATP-binding protein [Gryllotalpicola reticulitermitis]|uniref:ABC transporter ATP-binding protein n=1 Tax=Gryllotalpicola reticulitermitis TaxID=1184153 RepID=A0ABV8QBI8_9MICO
MSSTVVSMKGVAVERSGNTILSEVDWRVKNDQRWVVLGPNGAGKTTLLQLAAAQITPSAGTVTLLDEDVTNETDAAELRPHIGFASSALSRRLPYGESVLDIILTAAYGITARWKEEYEDIDERRAHRVLAEWNVDHLAERRFGELSDGEQKRVQIARSVMADPELLLLDEPAASLDLGAREELVRLLGGYAASPSSPAIVMVTHHVEEIPAGFTHAVLLVGGKIAASGRIDETLSSSNLSSAFGVDVVVESSGGRFTARAK